MSKHRGLLFIGFVLIVAVVVIVVLNFQPKADPPLAENLADNYTDTVAEPIIAQDGSYTILQSTDTQVIGEITTYKFGEKNSLSVMPSAMQSVVLNETPTLNEIDIVVTNVPGKKLLLSSAKDGSPFSVVQVIYQDQLFDFRGTDLFLDTLGQYIQFNQR